MSTRPSIALCHPWFGLGGSESAVMWGITALRKDYDITLVTASRVDLGKLNDAYGTQVEAGDFHLLRAPALPTLRNLAKLAHWRVKRFEQFCRTNTGNFDVPLSAYNPIDFGRPGIHLVGDFSWDEEIRAELFGPGTGVAPLRKSYPWLGSRLFGASGRDILDGHDFVAANSGWTSKLLAERFGLQNAPVLYPPVYVETPEGAPKRGSSHFVCIGRISPEKRVERIISILAQVRAKGHEHVNLTIAGQIGDDDYGQKITRLVEQHPWIEAVGYISGQSKFDLLASHPYALHACEGEAFGIGVAEMLLCGCVPFVARKGGPAEIVSNDALCFDTSEEAVSKISQMLTDAQHAANVRDSLITHGERFMPEAYVKGLRKLVERFRRRARSDQAA